MQDNVHDVPIIDHSNPCTCSPEAVTWNKILSFGHNEAGQTSTVKTKKVSYLLIVSISSAKLQIVMLEKDLPPRILSFALPITRFCVLC